MVTNDELDLAVHPRQFYEVVYESAPYCGIRRASRDVIFVCTECWLDGRIAPVVLIDKKNVAGVFCPYCGLSVARLEDLEDDEGERPDFVSLVEALRRKWKQTTKQ